MKSIRNVLAGSLLAGGAVLAVATGLTIAYAADAPGAAAPGAAAPGAAAPTPSGEHGPHGFGPYSKLGLTAEQQASIKAIFTAAKPQMKTLHEQMHANHLKLSQTKPDDPNYTTVVAEVAQANATLASQATSQRAELRAQMYAVLTPTQKTQLTALEAQWAANPHPHHHWGHRGDEAPATAPTT